MRLCHHIHWFIGFRNPGSGFAHYSPTLFGKGGINMIIETNIGNFGNFKDLLTCMTQEHHNTVDVLKADYWGINLKLTNDLQLSLSDVRKLVDSSR